MDVLAHRCFQRHFTLLQQIHPIVASALKGHWKPLNTICCGVDKLTKNIAGCNRFATHRSELHDFIDLIEEAGAQVVRVQ